MYQTKTTYVVDRLRELIIGCELEPGQRIVQHEIARRLAVSPTPVREAMRQLESEGFIESSPHLGAYVAERHLENLPEVFELRALLETRLTVQAMEHLSPEDMARLRAMAAGFRVAVERGEDAQIREINFRFHHDLWGRANRPVAVDLVNRLWARYPRTLMSEVPGRAMRSAEEHDTLLDALEAKDREAVEAVVRTHILGAFEDARLAGHPAFREPLSDTSALAP